MLTAKQAKAITVASHLESSHIKDLLNLVKQGAENGVTEANYSPYDHEKGQPYTFTEAEEETIEGLGYTMWWDRILCHYVVKW